MIMRAGRRRSRSRSSSSQSLLLIFSLLLPLVSLSSFHPQDNYLLTFTTNSNSNSSSPLLSSNPNSTHKIPPNSTPHTSYQPFSFSFPISSSAGPHLLRLHFSPLPAGPTSATFNVSASSFPLLTNFSPLPPPPPPPQEEAAAAEAEAAEFFFFSLDLPSLTLSFTPAVSTPTQNLAFVDAVELYSVPTDLILGTALMARDGGPADVSGHVLEVVHRVNVGGPRVTPENDTLWRTWVEDDGFLVGGRRGKAVRFSERLNYRQGGATRETAPESVYGTCREMGWRGNSSTADSYNLTWVLPVSSSDHGYLVRLHFCDIVSTALNELYFNVYINGYTAYKDLDLSFQSLDLASPYYIDFVVDSNPSGSIRVSVGPSNISRPWKANAILNGLEIMKINGIAKFSEPRKKNNIVLLIGSILGCFVLLCLFSVCLFMLLRLRRKKMLQRKQRTVSLESRPWSPLAGNSYSGLTELSVTSNLNLSLKIPFSEILLVTNNFDDNSVIGSGGFGKVYRGMLTDGTVVAVKRGNRESNNDGSRQGINEFQAEILILTKIRHRHLVSLIGYCEERSEMILVYEFMSNGPLQDHLYGSTKPKLSWKKRLEICIGAARGLHYLHTGTAQGVIIHRDVKSANILLDENYTAKVADFGLSRSAGPHIDQAHVSTGVKGSFGYLDPEYFRTQQLTDKSDVYSFGVVLLEVLCARPVINRQLSWEEVNLAEWGMMWQQKGHIEKIIDPFLKDEIDSKSLKKFGETVEKCLAQYGVDRPTMGNVLWNLERVLQLHESSSCREPANGEIH